MGRTKLRLVDGEAMEILSSSNTYQGSIQMVDQELTLSGNTGGDVIIGAVGTASDLVFEESSTISGQGTNTITLGVSGDTFLIGTGVTFDLGDQVSVGDDDGSADVGFTWLRQSSVGDQARIFLTTTTFAIDYANGITSGFAIRDYPNTDFSGSPTTRMSIDDSGNVVFGAGNATFGTGNIQFGNGHAYFAGGTTYKVESDGDAFFKTVQVTTTTEENVFTFNNVTEDRFAIYYTVNEEISFRVAENTGGSMSTVLQLGRSSGVTYARVGKLELATSSHYLTSSNGNLHSVNFENRCTFDEGFTITVNDSAMTTAGQIQIKTGAPVYGQNTTCIDMLSENYDILADRWQGINMESSVKIEGTGIAGGAWRGIRMFLPSNFLSGSNNSEQIEGILLDFDGIDISSKNDHLLFYGLNVLMPSTYNASDTVTYNSKFTGDGRTVVVCDNSYALNISGAVNVSTGGLTLSGDLSVTGATTITLTGTNINLTGITAVSGNFSVTGATTIALSGTNINLTGITAVTGALTATSYGGITEANLLDKSVTETISGAYTFTNATVIEDNSDVSRNALTIYRNSSPITTASSTHRSIYIVNDEGIEATGVIWKGLDIEHIEATEAGCDLYGIDIDWSSMPMTSNPDVYGIRIQLPATYGTGTEYAGYFSGDGRTVELCTDTLAINATGGDAVINAARIGKQASNDYMWLSHEDFATSTTSYAIIQESDGTTHINSATGKEIFFRINDIEIADITASGLQLTSGARVNDIDTAIESSPTDAQLLTAQAVQEYLADWNSGIYVIKPCNLIFSHGYPKTDGQNTYASDDSVTYLIGDVDLDWIRYDGSTSRYLKVTEMTITWYANSASNVIDDMHLYTKDTGGTFVLEQSKGSSVSAIAGYNTYNWNFTDETLTSSKIRFFFKVEFDATGGAVNWRFADIRVSYEYV
jgi:hypothetical protein